MAAQSRSSGTAPSSVPIFSRSLLSATSATSAVISTTRKGLRVEAQPGPGRFCVRLRGLRAPSVEPPRCKETQSSGIGRQALSASTPPLQPFLRVSWSAGLARGVETPGHFQLSLREGEAGERGAKGEAIAVTEQRSDHGFRGFHG